MSDKTKTESKAEQRSYTFEIRAEETEQGILLQEDR